MDEKKLSAMNDESLDEVAGGATNYDFQGNAINQPVSNVSLPQHLLACSFKNADGAVYACPSCGSTNFRICSADDRSVNLKCKNCGTKFMVAND
ncbi:MAG: hypothetical protein Q4E65_02160 [Clostridia bacterium]|nr:hypothetical protein [Clostridia bacterium]